MLAFWGAIRSGRRCGAGPQVGIPFLAFAGPRLGRTLAVRGTCCFLFCFHRTFGQSLAAITLRRHFFSQRFLARSFLINRQLWNLTPRPSQMFRLARCIVSLSGAALAPPVRPGVALSFRLSCLCSGRVPILQRRTPSPSKVEGSEARRGRLAGAANDRLWAPFLTYSALVNPNSSASGRPSAGLCRICAHCRKIQSNRASVFFLCKLSETDPAFPKYPRLPVLSCPGYTPAPSS